LRCVAFRKGYIVAYFSIVYICEPAVRIELEDASCWSIDWANSELIAVGCTNGTACSIPTILTNFRTGVIAVYNVGAVLKCGRSARDLLPTHYMPVHQSGVRAVAWVRAPPCATDGEADLHADPTVIASGGHDGLECLTDIRDPFGNAMNRTRGTLFPRLWLPTD
jgi:transcription factor C subunit 6